VKGFTSWSLRYKLLVVLLQFGITTVAVTGAISYIKHLRSLRQNAINQLTSVRRSKVYQLESYYRTIHRHVLTLSDDWMVIDPGEDVREIMLKEQGADARVVMGFWEAPRQFGWLAMRLLHDVNRRLGLPHAGTGATFSIDGYLPAADYYAEDFEGRLAHFTRTGKTRTPARADSFPRSSTG
jgi:hypothetical protein